MLINVNKPPIVDILTFMSRKIHFMLGRVEVEKGFIKSGQGNTIITEHRPTHATNIRFCNSLYKSEPNLINICPKR